MRSLFLSFGLAVLLPLLNGPGIRAQGSKPAKPGSTKATVAVFRLTGEVTESPAEESLPIFTTQQTSFLDLVSHVRKAATDPAIKAVVFLSEGASLGSAQREELREAMQLIRSSGKEIFAHTDSISTSGYVLLSGVSRLSMVPTSDLWLTGFHGEAPYLRGLLDKLGVQPDFLHCGAYKSASEIFMRHEPSPEADKMQNWLLDSKYETSVNLIAKGRNVDAAKVKAWIDNGPYIAEKAKAAGIIDAVEHRQDFEAMIKSKYGNDVVFNKKYGEKKPPQIDLSSPFAMFSFWGEMLGQAGKKKNSKSAIGIVYVDGAISLGGEGGSPFGGMGKGANSSEIRKALDEAARDDSIKAVVLRVDSPGGSAVASEIILDATRRVKAKKPFLVSMGNVAGSGGYYVACAADTIFADATTITGSIGVVGGKFATNAMWKKVGINFKEYKRGQYADLLSTAEVFSPVERERMQAWMDDIYGVFKGHVVASRGQKLKKPIDELAGGRVYTGLQALELGLVDKIGTLEDAIKEVAGEAKLRDYEVRVVPEPKNFIEQLLEELAGNKDDAPGVQMPAALANGRQQANLVELAMPYLQNLDPQRVRLIRIALSRLQLMQKEGLCLMMPETTLR